MVFVNYSKYFFVEKTQDEVNGWCRCAGGLFTSEGSETQQNEELVSKRCVFGENTVL